MWILKERHIVNELHRFIWKEKHLGMFDYRIKREGVYKKEFLDWLFKKELVSTQTNRLRRFWVFSVNERFDKRYIEDFFNRKEAIIRDCIKDGYIDIQGTLKEYTPLMLSPKGRRFIEIGQNIWDTLKHPFVLELIRYGIPVYGIIRIVEILKDKIL